MVAVALFSLIVMLFVPETHLKDINPVTSLDTTSADAAGVARRSASRSAQAAGG
jgi:hypothetical protein